MNFFKIRVLLKRIKCIRFMMADKSVSKGKKALVIAGLVYLFLPFDLIPAVVFPLSLLDDFVVWGLILWYLSSTLDKYWTGEKDKDYSKKYKSKNIIEDVEFEVNDADSQTKHEEAEANEQ